MEITYTYECSPVTLVTDQLTLKIENKETGAAMGIRIEINPRTGEPSLYINGYQALSVKPYATNAVQVDMLGY